MPPRQELSATNFAALEAAGREAFPGFELRALDRVASTQDVVLEAARRGAAEGLCCVAQEQTAGRGRLGRRWEAPPGSSLLVSVLLRPRGGPPTLTLAAGLAVLDTLDRETPVRAELKWPNDVVVGGAKLAGILAEANTAVALGIGLNLRVDRFPEGANGTSLQRLMPNPPRWDQLLAALLPALAGRLDALARHGLMGLRDNLLRRSHLMGREVIAEGPNGPVRGIAVDIDPAGGLVVRTPTGVTVAVSSGEVRLAG